MKLTFIKRGFFSKKSLKSFIMELSIYSEKQLEFDTILNFMNFYYSIKMKYLASDLLDKGLSPKHIKKAVVMAIKTANSSGIEVSKHFMPVFSGIDQDIIEDCKLSHLGYGLVLINADANLAVVGAFQIAILKEYLKGQLY